MDGASEPRQGTALEGGEYLIQLIVSIGVIHYSQLLGHFCGSLRAFRREVELWKDLASG